MISDLCEQTQTLPVVSIDQTDAANIAGDMPMIRPVRPWLQLTPLLALLISPLSCASSASDEVVFTPEVQRVYLPGDADAQIENPLVGDYDNFVNLADEQRTPEETQTIQSRVAFFDASHNAMAGNHHDAEVEYRRAMEMQPDSVVIPSALATNLLAMGRAEEAVALLEQTVAEHPEDATAWEELARARTQSGDNAGVIEALGHVAELRPRDASSRLAMSMAQAEAGDLNVALATLHEVREMPPDMRRFSPQDFFIVLTLADVAEEMSPDDAIFWYQKIIEARPEFLLTYSRLALLYQRQGNRDEAISVYRQAILRDPTNAGLHRGLITLFGPDHTDELIEWWSQLAREFPNDVEIQISYAGVLSGSDHNDDAIQSLMDLAERLPDSFEVNLTVGSLLQLNGQDEEAIPHLQRAVEINPDPNATEPIELLITSLARVGRLDEAQDLIESHFDEAERARHLILLARGRIRTQEYDKAEETFREAIALDPAQPRYHRDLMAFLADRDEDAKGLEAVMDSIETHGLIVREPTHTSHQFLWVNEFSNAIDDSNRDRLTDVITRAADADGSSSAMRTLGLYQSEFGDPSLANEAMLRAWDIDNAEPNRIRVIRFMLQEGDEEMARNLVTSAAEASPDSTRYIVWSGVMDWLEGNAEAASAEWNRAFAAPDYLPATMGTLRNLKTDDQEDAGLALSLALLRNRGKLFESIGRETVSYYGFIGLFADAIGDRFDDVESALLGAIGDEPTKEDYAIMGEFYLSQDRIDQAQEALLASMRIDPTDTEWTGGLSEIAGEHEAFGVAETVLSEAIRLNPGSEDLHYFLGFTYDEASRIGDAERELRRAIEIDPQNYLAINHLSYMFTVENINLDEALELAERAVELSDQDAMAGELNNNGFIVDTLGWAHYRLGDYDQAVRWLREAITRAEQGNIQDGVFYDHLGDALKADGQTEEALEAWDQAFQLFERRSEFDDLLAVGEKILEIQPERADIIDLMQQVRQTIESQNQPSMELLQDY